MNVWFNLELRLQIEAETTGKMARHGGKPEKKKYVSVEELISPNIWISDDLVPGRRKRPIAIGPSEARGKMHRTEFTLMSGLQVPDCLVGWGMTGEPPCSGQQCEGTMTAVGGSQCQDISVPCNSVPSPSSICVVESRVRTGQECSTEIRAARKDPRTATDMSVSELTETRDFTTSRGSMHSVINIAEVSDPSQNTENAK